jgi:methylmalonyl-CoA/ethylmalonyl-CoA epimerase
MHFDHIGIVVADLSLGRSTLEIGYGVTSWTDEYDDAINDVWVQFGRDATGICYELIAPLSSSSPVLRAQRQGTNITNHLAFTVPSLDHQREKLILHGFHPLADPKPAVAYGGARIQFFLSPINSLIELVEAPGHNHLYRETALQRSAQGSE